MRDHHAETGAEEFSDTLSPNDPRWLFASRVQMMFHSQNRVPSIGQLDDLIDTAMHMGFSNMHARAIINMVEEAQFRDGIDSDVVTKLLNLPAPESNHTQSDRTRWLTFGVLFAWSLMIAGLMQVV